MRHRLCSALTILLAAFSVAGTSWAATPPLTITLDNDGGDWGARINAADAQLGRDPGTIVVRGGGRFHTPVILSSYHTLRFGPGTYTNSYQGEGGAGALIMPKDHTVVEGSGWDTIIQETPGPAADSYALYSPYVSMKVDSGAQVNDMTLRNIHFSGVGISKNHNAADAAAGTGLLNGGTIENVWFNRTHAIGLTVGQTNYHGTSFAGNITVRGCKFTNVGGSQPGTPVGGGGVSMAIVNGRNITVINNTFLDPWGNAMLDVEPNYVFDAITNITIADNTFSAEGTTGNTSANYVYGVVLQTGGAATIGAITVKRNVFRGTTYQDSRIVPGAWYPGSSLLAAVYVLNGMHHVTVADNDIKFTGGSPIVLEGVDYSRVENNRILMPNRNLSVIGSHNVIQGNYIVTASSQGGYLFGIEEIRTRYYPSDYNSFFNNRTTGPITLVGPHSISRGNTVVQGLAFP